MSGLYKWLFYLATVRQLNHVVIKTIYTHCNWCTAVEISTGSNPIILISVYLPYQYPENEVEYLEKLGLINALTNELDTTCFVINGDWNANLREGGNSLFAKHNGSIV